MNEIMNIDVGAGEFWLSQQTTGSGVDVAVALQLRITGDLDTLIVLTPQEQNSEFDKDTAAAALASQPVTTGEHEQAIPGVWHRIPGALKRPARQLWHRHLLPQHPKMLKITLPSLGVDEEMAVPADLPIETSIQQGLTTSGLLHLHGTSLLRVSILNPNETSAEPPLRLSSSSAATKGTLYFNGPPGWLDGIIVFDGTAEHLPLQIDVT